MLQYHYLNPETFEDMGLTFSIDINPVVELRFMHYDKEMLYKLPEYADEHDFMSAGPGTPLTDVELYMWIHKILSDEVSHALRIAKQSNQKVDPFIKEEWGILSARPHRYSMYQGSSNIPVDKMSELIENMGIEPQEYRMYIPIIWNETLQQFDVLRHGDICRIRFVYSPDLEWYNNHLEGFVEHFKDFPLWH